MRAAQLSRCAALLLLLGVAYATVSGRPTVMDVRAGWNRRADVSVASSSQAGQQESYGYENYGVVEKEICLQEVARRACHLHQVEGCSANAADVTCDAVHSFWTSDLACCKDKHDDYNSGHRGSATVGDHLWGGAHGAIGSCDWTWHFVDSDAPALDITGNIEKLGSANAVCYFGADSQECGGPFCERLVMSLEGHIYGVASVYSYWGPSITEEAGCDISGDAGLRLAGRRSANRGTKTPAAKKAPTSPSSASIAADASAQYYHDEGRYENRVVYSGSAIVINGIVNSIAGPRREKWDSGVFEYVLQYEQELDVNGAPVPVTALDANTPWIRDKAYKFTFYKQSGY